MATVTLNPSDSSPYITLSGGNLQATGSGVTSGLTWRSVRSTQGGLTGKLYFEGTATAVTTAGLKFGVCNPAADLSNYPGSDTNGVSAIWGANGIYYGGGNIAGSGSPASGTTMGCAVDFTNKKIWFYNPTTGLWNNASTATQNPVTNTGGVSLTTPLAASKSLFGAASVYADGSGTDAITMNFGAATFANTPPSGFSAWNTAGGTPIVRASTLGLTALVQPTATVRVSTLGLTALVKPVATVRVSTLGLTALVQPTATIRVSTLGLTALVNLPAAGGVGTGKSAQINLMS